MLECTNISRMRLPSAVLPDCPLAMPDALVVRLPELLDLGVSGLVTIGFRKPVLSACSGRMGVQGLPDGRPQNKLLQFFWNGAIMVPNKFNSGKTPIETWT